MGIRCTQLMGLSSNAIAFLAANAKTKNERCGCPSCKTKHVKTETKEVYDKETGVRVGMFDDGPILYKYQLKDNSWVFEYIQASPWSSGPCIFLALRKGDKIPIKESLWSEDHIDNA